MDALHKKDKYRTKGNCKTIILSSKYHGKHTGKCKSHKHMTEGKGENWQSNKRHLSTTCTKTYSCTLIIIIVEASLHGTMGRRTDFLLLSIIHHFFPVHNNNSFFPFFSRALFVRGVSNECNSYSHTPSLSFANY